MTHAEKDATIRRLRRDIEDLRGRLRFSTRVGEQRTLWTWEGAPPWLATACGMAETLGREIVVRAPDGGSSPAKLAIFWVRRDAA